VAKLDRTKDHGEIWGRPGVKFEQNGKMFNANGDEVDYNGKLIKKKPTPAAPPKEPEGGGEPPKPEGGGEPPKVEPGMKHKGGGYYIVWNESNEVVGDKFSKEDAQAKVAELKANSEQINAALQDG